MRIEPYLFLEGRCDEAIAFYRHALDAELLMLMRYGDSPDPHACGPVDPAKVMHAALRVGDTMLLLSDGLAGGAPRFEGIALSLAIDDDAGARRCFDALADGGSVTSPLAATFFARSFGMLTDRFGVSWMVLTPKPM